MENLLNNVKQAHESVEQVKGKRLLYLLLVVFVVFSVVGFGAGALWDFSFNAEQSANSTNETPEEIFYEGKVIYINPQFYPDDNISYALVNSKNETIILLKGQSPSDAKLAVAEGLWGKAYGQVVQTQNGEEDVLIVDKIVLSQSP